MNGLRRRVTVLERRADDQAGLRSLVEEQAVLRAAGDRDMADMKLEIKATKDLVKALALTQSDHGRTLADHGRKLDRLQGDVSELKGDVSELKGDVSELKGDVSELKVGMRQIVEMLTHLIERESDS